MNEYKIIFTGAVGAGKTTAIAAISEIRPVVTDVKNYDPKVSKLSTTVGFDYGELSLDTGDKLRLYGTPGQSRFQFMWQALARKALGLVILLDHTSPHVLSQLTLYLQSFDPRLPCVIGVGRWTPEAVLSLDIYSETLASIDRVVPVLPVDVRNKEDVLMLIDVLLSQLETDLAGYEVAFYQENKGASYE